jgi:PTH1 family peptidyl-tRNA hydrolase
MTSDPQKSVSSGGIQLIVGLGNPGPEYANTRHNAGYWFIEKLCHQIQRDLVLETKFKACIAQVTLHHQNCRILQPITYMNHSGQSVGAVAHFYKIPAQQILVIHDELDLPVGTARLKFDGGHGGHNGLRDIIAHLGTRQFYRLRLGIAHPGVKEDVVNYVLQRPSKSDQAKILASIDDSLIVLPDIIEGKINKAMNKLHSMTN